MADVMLQCCLLDFFFFPHTFLSNICSSYIGALIGSIKSTLHDAVNQAILIALKTMTEARIMHDSLMMESHDSAQRALLTTKLAVRMYERPHGLPHQSW
jgi:hypothetical protein